MLNFSDVEKDDISKKRKADNSVEQEDETNKVFSFAFKCKNFTHLVYPLSYGHTVFSLHSCPILLKEFHVCLNF